MTNSLDDSAPTWVITLTDGVTGDRNRLPQLQRALGSTPTNFHVITIGINLPTEVEEEMKQLSAKFQVDVEETKGFFVRSDGTTEGLNEAFSVVKSRIPVSQMFELDGVLSDDECRRLVETFKPSIVDQCDMMSLSFWIKFLYRRVKVFDQNDSFNFNEEYDNLGSTLMTIMLDEAARLLMMNGSKDWLIENHTQLVYDFADPTSPQFRLICTSPGDMDPEVKN